MFTKRLAHNSYNKASSKLSQRVAEEAQLLAEEKWIIETLKNIKSQRNGLQIERLHLESMQSKLLASRNKDQTVTEPQPPAPEESTSTAAPPPALPTQVNQFDFDMTPIVTVLDDTAMCNLEELNLTVTNSVFNNDPYNAMCDEEDEEDIDNCVLDMDLLMSGR